MTLPVGAMIGGYSVERGLGSGGMGIVYLARHPVLARSDAIKVLSAELSADPDFRARFLREADLAATLEHPNIVRVYTRGTMDDGRLWIAMGYLAGTDADAALREGAMTTERAVHIVAEVAKALDYAHARGVVHRDIKPANFLLGEHAAGEPERVLLADFGIARALNEAHRLTATGTLMATVAFAAPEVIQGDPADHRADIYSLGCTLFRLLTNRNPFQGSLTAVMMGHLSSAPPPVTDFAPALPAAINGVLYTAMAKDPQHRYPTAGALAAAVAAAVSDSATAQTVQAPLLTPPATPHYIAPHDHGRTPQWQLHAPTFPAAAPVGPGAPPPQPPRRRAKPGRLWALSAAAAALVAALVAAIVLWPRDHQAPYPAADFVHEFGTTHLSQRPSAVAALTLADADTVMSLGVSPVAILAPSGQVPSWLQPLLHATKLLGDARSATVAPLHPDLIIDTDASATSYPDLAAIAPTITRPVNQRWTPQSRLTWIADILGEQSAGKSLLNDAAVAQAQARQDHPAFTGKTLTVFEFSASGLSAALPSAPNAGFFVGLGFSYVSTPGSGTSADDPRQTVAIDVNDLYMPRSEITVVIRTDPQAGGGGYSGLPSALTGTGSHVVVVDDPNTVAALDSLGPAATTYLTTTFVPTLADQIH